MMTTAELTAILEEEQERVEQRGERNRLLSEELSRVREKLTGQTALAAARLEEVNYLKMTIHCLFNDYGRHMSAEWKKALRPILGITVSSDD